MPDPLAQSEAVPIPDKLYFRIGEVAHLAGVKPHVLRYWESVFPPLAPKKSGKGHRLYRRKEVELVLEIKGLLYEKGYTIEGARKFLHGRGRSQAAAPARRPDQGQLFGIPSSMLDQIRRELEEILKLLQ